MPWSFTRKNGKKKVNSPPSSPQLTSTQVSVSSSTQKAQPKKSWLKNVAISYGLRTNTSLPTVAALSKKASEIRATADTAATGLAVAAGVSAAGSLGAALPISITLLGLAALTQKVASQVGTNIELRSNLMIIQHEVDRFFKIAKVMETIAAENGFELNTGSVNKFIGKLTTFIAMLSTEDVAKGILEYRQTSTQNPLQSTETSLPTFQTIDYTKVKGTIRGRLNRIFAPGEYLRQLVRDITILTVFMTILLGEFQLFMLYVGDPTKKNWTKGAAFQDMLSNTYRLAGVKPRPMGTPESQYTNQSSKMDEKRKNPLLARFYKGVGGDASRGITPQEAAAAEAFVNAALQGATEILQDRELQEEFEANHEEAAQGLAEEIEDEAFKQGLLTERQQVALDESSQAAAKKLLQAQETGGEQAAAAVAEEAVAEVAETVASTNQAGGRRRKTLKQKRRLAPKRDRGH